MPVPMVRMRGESSSRGDARRLRLEALPGGRVRVRIHTPDDTSGYSFEVPRAALDRLAVPGPVPEQRLPVDGTTATVCTAVRPDLHVYVWVYTPGDDGWDILVMQMTLAKQLAELVRT